MPYLKFSRDKRGYEHFAIVEPGTARRGKPPRARVLFWFRTPPQLKVGRHPFTDEVRRAIEAQNPGVRFDWPRLLATPIPPPDAEHWRERRRAEKAARQAAREAGETSDAGETREAGESDEPAEAGQTGEAGETEGAGEAVEAEEAGEVIAAGVDAEATDPLPASDPSAATGSAPAAAAGEQAAGGRRRRRRGRRKRHRAAEPGPAPEAPNVPVPPTEEV